MIGPENSGHFLNQSDSSPNPIATWSLTFSRASDSLLVFTLISRKLLPMIGCCRHSIEKRSSLEKYALKKDSLWTLNGVAAPPVVPRLLSVWSM